MTMSTASPLYVAPPDQVLIPVDDDVLVGQLFRAPGAAPHPTALFLMGLPGSPFRYGFLGSGLRTLGWNTLLFAYRGTWGSSGTFSIDHLLSDALAAAQYLGVDPTVDPTDMLLIGYSTGGWVGSLLAASDPRFRRIVLLQPLTDPDTLSRRASSGELDLERMVGPLMMRVLGSSYAEAFLTGLRGRAPTMEATPRLGDRDFLIVSGDADRLIRTEDVAHLAAALPRAQWVRLPGVAHGATPPEWLLGAITKWLAGESIDVPVPAA